MNSAISLVNELTVKVELQVF